MTFRALAQAAAGQSRHVRLMLEQVDRTGTAIATHSLADLEAPQIIAGLKQANRRVTFRQVAAPGRVPGRIDPALERALADALFRPVRVQVRAPGSLPPEVA